MKNRLLMFLLAIIFLTCNKASEFPLAKDYPIIITQPITELDTAGVTFSAIVNSLGKDSNIQEYGFIWKGNENTFRLALPELDLSEGTELQFRVTSNLEKEIEYIYQGYIQTEDKLVLGNEIRFISLGTSKPNITNFSPKEGIDGTVVSLSGNNFSQNTSNNIVFVENIKAEVLFSNRDSIVFKIPNSTHFGTAEISLVVGEQEVVATDKFKIFGPKITSISTTEGKAGDIIKITGEYFDKNGNNLNVFFDRLFEGDDFGAYFEPFQAQILNYSENMIELQVPILARDVDFLRNAMMKIKVRNGSKIATLDQLFTMKKTWERKSPPLLFDYDFGGNIGFEYDDFGYILHYQLGELFEYDANKDAWQSIADYPGNKSTNDLFVVTGSKVLRFSGNLEDPTWEYDFLNKKWTEKNAIPFSFNKATYFQLGRKVYITTSQGGLWKYDINEKKFFNLKPVNELSTHFSYSFVQENNAFLVSYGKNWIFDKFNERWIEHGVNDFDRTQFAVDAIGFYHKGKGYVIEDGEYIYRFNAQDSEWVLVSKYPDFDHSTKTSFLINDEAYIVATQSYISSGAPFLFKFLD